MYFPKPLFKERMKKLLYNEEDYKNYFSILKSPPKNIIRCNTIRISPEELKNKLEKKGWIVIQPYKKYPYIMIIENKLKPGELGKSEEHLDGLYYIQELSSMMASIALSPKENDIVLDLCSAPGSKTTHLSMIMNNKGTIIANDNDKKRIIILKENLQRCFCTNVIVTRNDAIQLCNKLKNKNIEINKILLDAPCSGEGTLRTDNKTFLLWNIKMIKKFSSLQKKMIASALSLLKSNCELIYSTCTHAPEENEEVIDFALKNFDVDLIRIDLPIKTREGITEWYTKKYDKRVKLCNRIYPHDNNTEGFFIAKLKKK
ncbi:MAG: RsmB/NOP family class I SAM-dependent RNA methyltransferase [Candidatus Pacearchaeota archaeon]